MADSSKTLFDLLSWQRLEEFIRNGEAESLYYECKAPGDPKLTRDLRLHLAKALSGFSNTNGGILIWGLSTTKHAHSGLDVMTQLEPIGNCKSFAQQVANEIPGLSTPGVINAEVKTLTETPTETRGIVVAHVPKFVGDPVQSTEDQRFYYRSGDDFVVAPYEMVKRLFAATESPDLHLVFPDQNLSRDSNLAWSIPIGLQNRSTAIAEHVLCMVRLLAANSYESVHSYLLLDITSINPGGNRTFSVYLEQVVHQGCTMIIGNVYVKFKAEDPSKGVIRIEADIFANHMKMRSSKLELLIGPGGLTSHSIQEDFKP